MLSKEDDPVNPLNVYSKSKWIGEENIQQKGSAYLILRTSLVYSLRGNGFANKVLAWSSQSKSLKIVDDQVGCPTWAGSLAETTMKAISEHQTNILDVIHGRRGVCHLAGSGHTSRYEWARHILANDPSGTEQLVQAIEHARTSDFPTPAQRPLFSALDCSKFEKTFGIRLSNWKTSLHRAMVE